MTTLVEAAPNSGIFIPQNFAFKAGQGGMQALRTRGGWVLANFNKEMKQIRLKKDHITWLTAKFPHLAEILVRNGETLRRAQAMQSRLTAITANPSYINVESIDATRPNLTGIDARDSETITRAVTYVDMGANPPQRRFLFSEFEVGKNFRVDEATVQYILSGQELADANAGKLGKFGTGAQMSLREATDLRVHVLDLNRLVTGDAMVNHYSKLLATHEALLQDLVEKFKLNPKGIISLSLREVYLEAAAMIFSDGASTTTKASVVRQGTNAGAKSPQVNELSVKVTVKPGTTGAAIVNVVPNSLVSRFMNVDAADLARLKAVAATFLPKITQAFATVK